MRLKVAIDARLVAGTSTGDSTYWTGLLEGLAALSDDLELLLISNAARPKEIPFNAKWSWITVPARSSRWWSLVSFPLVARKLGAQVVHVQYSLSPLIRLPSITTVHDVSFFIGPEWFGVKDRVLLRSTVPSAIKRSKAVIAVSETSKGEIEKFVPAARGKVVVTPLAVPSWIQPAETAVPSDQVRKKQAPYAFALGTRWARKNLELAVQAVEALPANVELELLIAGKGSEGLGEGKRVKPLGYVENDQLATLYGNAAAFIFPSLHEGFGLPIIEAFACGCPVLYGPGGACPETAGGAGLAINGYAPEAWTEALVKVLALKPKELEDLKAKGYRRAESFSWYKTAERTAQVYRDAAQK